MTDRISPQHRSDNMCAGRGSGTAPELCVRQITHRSFRLSYRFRLHPGTYPENQRQWLEGVGGRWWFGNAKQ